MNNLIQDISVLFQIKEDYLNKMIDVSNDVISHDILESIKNKETNTVIDIGIGLLNICILDDHLEYKFIPSEELENNILKTYRTKKSNLVSRVETKLTTKILNMYKELL